MAAVLSSSSVVPPFVVDAAFSSSSSFVGGSLVSSLGASHHYHHEQQRINHSGITFHRSISQRERHAFVSSSAAAAASAAMKTTKRGVKIASSSSSSSSTMSQLNALPDITAAAITTTTTTTTARAATTSSSTTAILSTSAARALSALTATMAGGMAAGALHAISGPDHLAAVIPRCVGLPWHRAGRIGAVWGFGHGLSATSIGLLGYAFKSGLLGSHILDNALLGGSGGRSGRSLYFIQHHAGSVMEFTIGISLIIIGLLGIKEAREWDGSDDDTAPTTASITTSTASVVANETAVVQRPSTSSSSATSHHHNHHHHHTSFDVLPKEYAPTRKRAVLLNGMLHGFSWDGAPSLAPAVAISTLRGSLTFLLSYTIGTMGAMALATSVIGEGTKRMSGKLDMPNLPIVLSLWSSALALFVGVIWCILAVR